MSDIDQDLYGDLDKNIGKVSGNSNSRQINIQQEREDIVNLNAELESAKKENDTLKRNIGTLYRTATKELQRKDDRITELEKELTGRR
jgi:predicted RNase H-like nuclease (RuvC/YqgF family)|eukprot:scaffold10926_cov297-Chaetoceros_neogracile.AAC.1